MQQLLIDCRRRQKPRVGIPYDDLAAMAPISTKRTTLLSIADNPARQQ